MEMNFHGENVNGSECDGGGRDIRLVKIISMVMLMMPK